MLFYLMRLEIHGRIENHKLLLHALTIRAGVVVLVEVLLQSVVIEEVARVVSIRHSIAQMATLVPVAAVGVKLISAVESLPAKAALWMSLKTSLFGGSWCVVAVPLMLAQLLLGEELVLMRKDLLIPSAKIAHDLLVYCANVTVQVGPAEASSITVRVWAIVAKKHNSVLKDLLLLIADAHVVVLSEEIIGLELLEPLLSIVCEDHCRRFGATMRACLGLVKSAQS